MLWVLFLLVLPVQAWAAYDLPNVDADCPENCRKIPWSAGSDQWNAGTLPTYAGVTCGGLTEGNGTTNNASAIQACLNNLSSGHAAVIPPGIYYVNGPITIPSNRALRGSGSSNCTQGRWLSSTFAGDTGAGAACTTLKMGSSGVIRIGTDNPSFGSEIRIASGYTKGSQSLTLSTSNHGLSANNWISIFEDTDPAIVSNGNGGCDWCGENSGSNLIQQFARVTSVNGATIGISRPLYYTYLSGRNPGVKRTTWSAQYAGIEDLKINGNYTDIGDPLLELRGTLFSWAKGIETFNASATSQTGHVKTRWSHGNEYRDGYHHSGRDHGSDKNYGIFFYFWNSDHKIENNILRAHRHSILFEGGGSGCAILYNYVDDNWEGQGPDYLGSARHNHGPHPMFNLWEGNTISHLEADDVFGGSSHGVIFRNWLWGGETDGPDRTSAATWGFYALDIRGPNWYYSAVGNVLGIPSWTSGTVRATSSSSCGGSRIAYRIGCQDSGDYGSGFDATSNNSFIAHGNYDYLTKGVAYWDGGSDHALKNSMYYASKPSWYGGCSWPPIDPAGPLTADTPARLRYAGLRCPGDSKRPAMPTSPSAH
jgi:hypothetical protein